MHLLKILCRRISFVVSPHSLSMIFIGIGILLRAKHYFENPSFWGDEAWIAHAVMRRSFKDILLVLNIDRHDPLGFHLIEKSLVTLFGDSEFVFRLFPFTCSIGAIILFYFLAKRCLRPQAVPIATGLFAFCDQLTIYAAETHPYACDVLITVLMLLSLKHFKNPLSDQRSRRNILYISIGGSIFIWMSYPSIFILCGISLTLFLRYVTERDWQALRRSAIPMGLWALSFLIYYAHYLYPVTHKSYMKTFLMSLNPHPFFSLAWIKVFFHYFLTAFEMPLGLVPAAYGCLVFFIGSFTLFFKNKYLFYGTHIPIALTILAAALNIYPFYGRLILFLIPVFILVLSEGLTSLVQKNRVYPLITSPILCLALLAAPIDRSWFTLTHKQEIAEVRPLITYLKHHWKKGDALFMENDTQYPYFYYIHRLEFKNAPRPTAVFSNRPFNDSKTGKPFFFIAYEGWKSCERIGPGNAIPCVDKRVYADSQGVFPRTPRAWFLIAQTRDGLEDLLFTKLTQIGKKNEEVRTPTSSLLLYDLSD